MKQLLILALTSLALSSCVIKGKTIKDVPTLNSKNIHTTQLQNLPSKNISIQVVDSRKEDIYSNQVRTELSRAVSEALTREGFNIVASGENELVLTIHDFETKEFKEGCVKIAGALTIPKKAKVSSDSSACFESKSPFGQKMSADITKSYEEALTIMFKGLNQSLNQL
jgi:uncharacterized lipoprotein YajG